MDKVNHPETVVLWTPVGYYFVVPNQVQMLSDLSKLLAETFIPASKDLGETGFVLVASLNDWQEIASALLGGREVIEIFRCPFSFNLYGFCICQFAVFSSCARFLWERERPRFPEVQWTLGILARFQAFSTHQHYSA